MTTPEPQPIVTDQLSPSFVAICQNLVAIGRTDLVPPTWLPFLEACAGAGVRLDPYAHADSDDEVIEEFQGLTLNELCGAGVL